MREVVVQFRNPVMLYSVGIDSEARRVSRRPQFLREWGHHDKIDIEEIFAGGP